MTSKTKFEVERVVQPPFPTNTSNSSSRNRGFRVIGSLVLLAAALNLSTFLPAAPNWRFLYNGIFSSGASSQATLADDGITWQDDTWPIRQQTPWDISTDFPHPRVLEYDVREGTWLRLDVHPKTGDIVFDMLGDLYCIPGDSTFRNSEEDSEVVQARSVTLGIPHDSDPHFSPDGEKIVFRSDAGLGLENIWVMDWTGCLEMDVRRDDDSSLKEAWATAFEDHDLLSYGIVETSERKYRRLLREGRAGAQMVTNETYRYVTDARFHPSGKKVVATKWYTSGRSLGAGEGWEYDIPSSNTSTIAAGSGTRLVGRTLPPGWTMDNYGDQQIGPEQLIWSGEDALIYSKNVKRESTGSFEYSEDVHQGIYAIFSYNITTGATETLVDASPGGASRPELSRDGRTLAFVRRVRDHEVLVLKDLETGTIHHVWDGLTYDLTTISAPMGTYPSFAFTPNDSAIIIWAAGKIHRVPLSTNHRGERITGGSPHTIGFKAHIMKNVASTLSIPRAVDLVDLETRPKQRVRAFRDLKVDDTGKKVVFRAGNVPVVQVVGKNSPTKVPVLHDDEGLTPYYSPSFVPGTDGNLIIHSRWSDTDFTTFEVADLAKDEAYEVEGLPLGRFLSPVLCGCKGSKRTIAFVKTGGDYLSGDIVATANTGLYIGDIDLEPSLSAKKIKISNLRLVPTEINMFDSVELSFIKKNRKLLVQQSSRAFVIDLQGKPVDLTGKPPHFTLASGKMSAELSVSTRSTCCLRRWFNKFFGKEDSGFDAENVAFVDFFHVYVAPGKKIKSGEEVWSRPANATKGLARVSLDGGHDITWSADGKKLFWFLGPFLHSLEVSKLSKCSSQIENDATKFGISCVKNLLEYQEIVVEHSTDIARLKESAKSFSQSDNADVVVIHNATILTMETGDLQDDLIKGGMLVIRGGVIEDIYSVANAPALTTYMGSMVIDAQGGLVIPGFIDSHAHWGGMSNPHPAKSWELQTFLAFGVTTLHNPSSDTVDGYVERSRLESGQFVGPRIFHTGTIIYGASEAPYHQLAEDMDEAHAALIRIKAEGGPFSTSYKNYNQPIRASRQRLLLTAREMGMLCVPEGGMNYDWDLTYIIDGMTTVEHSIPVPVLYDDVLQLFTLSGTANTPTHLVNYGGAFGEQIVWATQDVPNDPKLLRFTRHDILEVVTESTARPKQSFQLFNTSASIGKMVDMGFKALIGAHGEPPLGVNYHAEMAFANAGMNNYQTLQAATSWAAQVFGMFDSVGSLSSGKLADLLVYPADVDLLDGPIQGTRQLKYVMRGGRLWDAETMDEMWPVKSKAQVMPPLNP
ncbi:hypothetical protein K435DRAFT_722853 [Dendrothele bispora CBS 962.96]|uniref:Amidohydrolase-related domain-containing protein n=1 Tax=Dendrothele bispora (strain CBS 962.96) TaxID=1314807 RepID=A0A4S8M2L2_DENBC|nr:hypothetical protein K435DRAFT_722853 [Dendrothele bispora CBS 962.96]